MFLITCGPSVVRFQPQGLFCRALHSWKSF